MELESRRPLEALDLVIAYTNYVLADRRSEHYLDNVILLYSLIENLVKLLVLDHALRRNRAKGEHTSIPHRFLRGLTLRHALRIAVRSHLIGFDLYTDVDAVRTERNDLVHQLWMYEHWHNPSVLRPKLEKLARITNELLAVFQSPTGDLDVYRSGEGTVR
jgi:hypothetical protein